MVYYLVRIELVHLGLVLFTFMAGIAFACHADFLCSTASMVRRGKSPTYVEDGVRYLCALVRRLYLGLATYQRRVDVPVG